MLKVLQFQESACSLAYIMLHLNGERSAIVGGELDNCQLDVLWDIDLQQEEVGAG